MRFLLTARMKTEQRLPDGSLLLFKNHIVKRMRLQIFLQNTHFGRYIQHQNGFYHAVWPPSALKSAPVMKLLASLKRNKTGPRYSSAVDNRLSMLSSDHSFSRFGSESVSLVNRVLMYPGLIELTLIDGYPIRLPHSAAIERAIWTTADLDEL